MKFKELIKPEVEEIVKNANFTREELETFILLSRGMTLTEIAYSLNICERTVCRRIVGIKRKIYRLERGNNDRK